MDSLILCPKQALITQGKFKHIKFQYESIFCKKEQILNSKARSITGYFLIFDLQKPQKLHYTRGSSRSHEIRLIQIRWHGIPMPNTNSPNVSFSIIHPKTQKSLTISENLNGHFSLQSTYKNDITL